VRFHFRISEGGVDCLVEAFDDFGRRALGRANANPAARLVAGYEFTQGGDAGQQVRTRRGSDRKCTQLAGSDVLDHRTYCRKSNLYLSRKQIGYKACPIWHVNHIDACHGLEQFAEDMARGPASGRRHIDLARIGLGKIDELGNRFGRELPLSSPPRCYPRCDLRLIATFRPLSVMLHAPS
jgi:hypothetical protein